PADGTTTINIGSIGGFNDNVTLSVTGLPAGATSSFGTNPVTPVGTSILTFSNTGAVAPGTYPVVVQGVSTTGIKTVDITLIIANPTTTIATLTTPINGSTGVTIPTAFTWSNSGTGILYDIDISTDPGFSTIIDNAVALSTNSYNSATLLPSTTYYWRVKAYTLCSSAAFSSIFSFTTTTNTCITTMSTNIPIVISATTTSIITSIITIPTNGTITDVNVVSLTGQHSWINDLIVTLTSPQGTVVSLWNQICNNENNFNLNFDDAGATGALPCPPIGGGTYQPAGSLASFNGEISAGVWTLTIQDMFNQDGGSLDTWGLEICATPCTTIPTFTQLGPYCIGDVPGTLPTTSTNSFNGTWDATISTASAGTTTYTFTPAVGQCAVSSTMDVAVSAFTTPTFTQLGPYCVGDTPATLPTTSDNGIAGTWDAA
ncbi:MAG: proprotein convertase P-domain-containing protein, partial [Vicingaceae bacterium]